MRFLPSFILPILLSIFTIAQEDAFLKQMDSQITLDGQNIDIDRNLNVNPNAETQKSGPLLSDVLTIQTSASIFYSYARETSTGKLLSTEGSRITVFAPTNKAVMALARKPHEGPTPITDGTIISEEEFDKKSRENVERWIQAHIVPLYPIKLLPTSQFEALLEGVVINVDGGPDWTGDYPEGEPVWKHIVLNKNITIINELEASNGRLYLIDGAIYG